MRGIMIKVCAYCKMEVESFKDHEKVEHLEKLGRPKKHGASRNYFDLWKKVYDVCPHCNYCYDDLSVITERGKEFLNSDKYKKIQNNKLFEQLQLLRPNKIYNYMLAGYIYEHEENFLEAGKAFANASDDFYGELIFLEEDEDEELLNKLQKIAEKLYDKAIDMLNKHCNLNSDDLNAQIFLCGLLSGGREDQKELSKEMIKKLLTENLSNEQKDMLVFIHKTTY